MPEIVPFSQLALVNPPLTVELPAPNQPVSFIPMADVSDTGEWTTRQIRRLRDIGAGYTPFQENDVLFAKITPCMENGKGCHACGLLNGVGFGSTEFHVLRARGETSPRYIYHWSRFEPLRKKAEAAMSGSAGQQRVEASFFDRFTIPDLPPKEQPRIAEMLDTLDAAIRETEAVVAKLRQVKAGLLHDLLTRGLDEHGQLRDPALHPEQFQDSPLGRIPKAWQVCPMEEVIESAVDGPFGSHLKTSHYVSEPGVRVVRLQNLGLGEFLDDDRAYVSEEHAKSLNRHEVQAGDLLVASLGDESHPLARACLFPERSPPGIVKADCFRLRARSERAVNGFLMLQLNCPVRRGIVNRLGQGVTRDRLNLGALVRVPICRPEVQEQERIVQRWLGIETRLDLESKALSKLRSLKRGLAHDLLTGRVRVKIGGCA